jgi:lantibiotic modifying enzyme
LRPRFFSLLPRVAYAIAGAVAALRYFRRRFGGDGLLDAAVRHDDRLISEARRDDCGWWWITIPGVGGQTGFAHGAAGIAWALVELWSAAGEERFRRAAFEAIRFKTFRCATGRQGVRTL